MAVPIALGPPAVVARIIERVDWRACEVGHPEKTLYVNSNNTCLLYLPNCFRLGYVRVLRYASARANRPKQYDNSHTPKNRFHLCTPFPCNTTPPGCFTEIAY